MCVRYKDGKGICSNACHFTPFPTHLQACVFWFVRGCFPVCQQKFSQTCADVFQLLRRSFTAHSYGLYDPQLWVVRPTIMGCTTHGYGLYDPQLWAVKVVLTIGKTSPHERENMYRQRQKNASPVSPGRETIGEAVEPKSVIRPFREYLCPLSVLWRRFLLPFLST